MALTRRQLLKRAGLGLGAVAFAGCTIPDREMEVQSPARLPEDLVEGFDAFYATLCRQCPSPEGILVRVMEGRAKKIEGNPDYPVNLGKHSARCEASLQALYHPDRIRFPLKRVGERGQAEFVQISWNEALDQFVGALKAQQHTPAGVVFITEPLKGHLGLLVDKFVDSYGGEHLSFETLEETVLRESVKRVLGQNRLPQFDIAHSNYILSFGSDFLGNWLSPVQYSREYGEFRQGENRQRGVLVQIEPRFSLTAANADKWLPVFPGSEGVLALSIASVILDEGLVDPSLATAFSNLFGENVMKNFRPEIVAHSIGSHITPDVIKDLAHSFAHNQPGLAIAGGSAGASTNGLFNLSSVYALNLLVGNIGKPGGIFFNPDSPLEGVSDSTNVTSFRKWGDVISKMNAGGIQVAVIRGVDPVYGLSATTNFKSSLEKVPLIVSMSSFIDETTAMADLVLPDYVALEDWGDDIPDPGPGFAAVGFQQPVVVPFGQTDGRKYELVPAGEPRAFGDVLLTVADELGSAVSGALPWKSFQEIVQEGARGLYRTQSGKLPMADGSSVVAPSFASFWSGLLQRGGWWDQSSRPSTVGVFPKELPGPSTASFSGNPKDYPLYLMPFLSHSLGDGKGANLPWLQATPDPLTTATWVTWVEVNPQDAKGMGDLREGDVVEVESAHGSIEALVYVHPAAPPGILSIPIGQGHSFYGRYAEQRGSNVLDIIAPHLVEGSDAWAWASTRVRINKTGRRTRIPKAEGMVVPIQVDHQPIVQVTRG